MRLPYKILQVRNNTIESEHLASFAICKDNRIILKAGSAQPFFIRSAAKFIQALASLQLINSQGVKLTDQQVAIMAASHAGNSEQIKLVHQILKIAKIPESQLCCGTHYPFSEKVKNNLLRKNQKPTEIYHNCSGKHAGMLLASKLNGWDLSNYFLDKHPIQKQIKKVLTELAGKKSKLIKTGVDGCGVPTFALPLDLAAMILYRLFNQPIKTVDQPVQEQLCRAVTNYPEIIYGNGLFPTEIFSILKEKFVSKEGAEGFLWFYLPSAKLSGAIKIHDGHARAFKPLVYALLKKYLSPADFRKIEKKSRKILYNYRGEIVGDFRLKTR